MAKTCKVEGCTNPVFTHGYCYYHRNLYYKYSNKPRKKQNINSLSTKKRQKKRQLSHLKNDLIRENGPICFFCGKEIENPDLAHIFPISLFPEYETEPWNVILSCRKHQIIFDNHSFDEIMDIPNIDFILGIIKAIDISYYYRLKQRGKKSWQK